MFVVVRQGWARVYPGLMEHGTSGEGRYQKLSKRGPEEALMLHGLAA